MPLRWDDFSSDSGTETVPLLLSVRSQSLILAAMDYIQNRANWLEDTTDADWDEIEKAIGETVEEIIEVNEMPQGTISGARVTRTTPQTITSTGVWTSIIFDAQFSNHNDGYFDSGQPTRLVVPVNGIYIFGGSFLWQANTSADNFRRQARIRRTGLFTETMDSSTIVNREVGMNMVSTAYITAGDYIELQAFTDVANLQILSQNANSPNFWIELLREL